MVLSGRQLKKARMTDWRMHIFGLQRRRAYENIFDHAANRVEVVSERNRNADFCNLYACSRVSDTGAVFGSLPAFPEATYTFLEPSFGAVATISICARRCHGTAACNIRLQK